METDEDSTAHICMCLCTCTNICAHTDLSMYAHMHTLFKKLLFLSRDNYGIFYQTSDSIRLPVAVDVCHTVTQCFKMLIMSNSCLMTYLTL